MTDADALARFGGGDAPVDEPLAVALAPDTAKIPDEPDAKVESAFKDYLKEAYEGDDPARLVQLCASPKARKAAHGMSLLATIEGYEDAAIALLDLDPRGPERAFFNAAFNAA